MAGLQVAVVGTGAVGLAMVQVLEERSFPVAGIKMLATARSAGKKVRFAGEDVTIEETKPDSFKGVDLALFAGGDASKIYAKAAVEHGAVVIDNGSTFRLDPEVPLIIPEVNPEAARKHKGIIANPNCSTIQMVVALKPIHDAAHIKRVVVSTYQAVSGAGAEAMEELRRQAPAVLAGETAAPEVFPYQIAFNLLPHIDVFMDNGYCKEEMKMILETKKIMEAPEMQITATVVRVPVFIGHSESVNVETEKKLTADEARRLLAEFPGVVVEDDPSQKLYPLPIKAVGRDEVFVGRIREDFSIPCGINFWVVADNLRKGAATNAVQIGELLLKYDLV